MRKGPLETAGLFLWYNDAMKLLPPADKTILFQSYAFGSYEYLWSMISFSDLVHYELLCMPFKLNGAWTAALRPPVKRSFNLAEYKAMRGGKVSKHKEYDCWG